MSDPLLIVGGGLAGLTAARRLHRAGVALRLLEGRQRLGGRILSVDASGAVATDGFDLGPSWFWPGSQPALNALLTELGLTAFPQNSEGDIVVHRMTREEPRRYRLSAQQALQSMRLAGGSGALVQALAADLPADSIRLGARVTHVTRDALSVQVRLTTASGSETMRASHVLFAVPPRLLEATVTFSPALDAATAERWRATPTWMASHAKVFALYEEPFWREAGLSGTAQSMAGPLVEIHDATTASGQAALFGFVGVPAELRAAVGEKALVAAAIQQLVRLFGPQAVSPSGTLFKDWAADPLTATHADRLGGGPPVVANSQPWVGEAWRDRVSLAGSETADFEPGYLAGAVDAAERAVADIMS
jgi:monoamine oxidase